MRIEQLEGKELYRTRPLYQSIFRDTELFTDFFYRKAEKDGKAIVCMDCLLYTSPSPRDA